MREETQGSCSSLFHWAEECETRGGRPLRSRTRVRRQSHQNLRETYIEVLVNPMRTSIYSSERSVKRRRNASACVRRGLGRAE